MSLRHRLLLLLLLAAMATTLTATGATWYWARREIDELLDYQLRQQALSLEDKAYLLGQVAVVEPDPEQHIVTQLWDRRGVLRYQSHHGVILERPRHNGYDSVSTEQEDWRVYAMELGPWVVQLAQPLSTRRIIATKAALRLLYPAMAVLPLLALLIWWAVGRVLAPLSSLAQTIGRRDPAALEPLSLANPPQEVGLMVDALNELIARQRALLAGQQDFMADAAHELRTPLMAIRLQLQLLERASSEQERTEALAELKLGMARTTTLVERLLAIARLDSSAVGGAQESVELTGLLERARQEVSTLARERAIDLHIEAESPINVLGEARSLTSLVVNLLENALRYTPEGGRVFASVSATRNGARLTVIDTGPGIPASERTRVFERFHRVPGTKAPGSGLGLAIVKRVADLHRASVNIDDAPGGGALITVNFPPLLEQRAGLRPA